MVLEMQHHLCKLRLKANMIDDHQVEYLIEILFMFAC